MAEKKYIQCVDRSFDIIEYIGNNKEAKLNEICDALDLKAPTAHGLIQTLEHRGYIARLGKTHYTLGLNCLKMGLMFGNASDENQQIHTLLRELVDEVNETCYFEITVGEYNYFYDMVLSTQALKVVPYEEKYVKLPDVSAVTKLYISKDKNIRYATDMEEVAEDLNCMAIPFKTDGVITATIAFTGPSTRFTAEKMEAAYESFLKIMKRNHLSEHI